MIRLATTGSALLLGAPLVVATSCIVNGQPDTEEGVAEACYSDAENAALEADDPNNQQNAALRNQLLGNAQVDCAKKTSGPDFTEVRCNPFVPGFDGIVQFKPLAGTCAQALENGLEGTPLKKNASCPDKPAASASASASGEAAADGAANEATAAAVPTTGGG